jgi:hypothetical protein
LSQYPPARFEDIRIASSLRETRTNCIAWRKGIIETIGDTTTETVMVAIRTATIQPAENLYLNKAAFSGRFLYALLLGDSEFVAGTLRSAEERMLL